MKYSILPILVAAFLALVATSDCRAQAQTVLVYTANTFGEHSPCPS